jgi:hypothetical protein
MRSVNQGSRGRPTCRLAAVAALGAAASLAACSKSQEPAAAPEPATVTGQQLQQAPAAPSDAGAAGLPSQPGYAPNVGTDPYGELDRAEREIEAALLGNDTAGQPLATGDRCTTVCKALASMRRSADQICSLDATRCTAAKDRLTKAEERAKQACPTCSTPT